MIIMLTVAATQKSSESGSGRYKMLMNEATIAVDKIIKYETGLEKGLWRNTITLVADDGPQALGVDDGKLHTEQSDTLTKYIPSSFDLDKIIILLKIN